MSKLAGLAAGVLALLGAERAWTQSDTGAAEIVKVADAYVAASLKGDAKALAALYTEDAVEMPPHQPLIKGRAAIERHYTKQFGGPEKLKSFSLTHLDTRAAGDLGYDVGTYQQTITDGQEPMDDTGKYTVILKRSGGEWKVAYAIYNSDQHPPPMKESGPSKAP